MNQKIGITSTIPIEILYAAGRIPVDLNNNFMTDKDPYSLVDSAEMDGFPRNSCAWIKGLYSVAVRSGISEIIAVIEGDCSQNHSLMEVLRSRGKRVIPFAYPSSRDPNLLKLEMERLMDRLGVGWADVSRAKERIDQIRRKIRYIDEITWRSDLVSGEDNHLFLINTTDMLGDLDRFEREIDIVLNTISNKPHLTDQKRLRIGFIGIPPIVSDLYRFTEGLGARVVFNEVQRQFSMPYETDGLVEQYLIYTYPYDILDRINDIKMEVLRRKIDGIIHYVQSFCHHQIEDMIFRKDIDKSILTLEFDRPGPLDERSKIRIEGFIDMLRDRKGLRG
ncbi:MAG: 2-hydroxyacyl-CoA dehydratase family protein [Nitrospirota bacterium]